MFLQWCCHCSRIFQSKFGKASSYCFNLTQMKCFMTLIIVQYNADKLRDPFKFVQHEKFLELGNHILNDRVLFWNYQNIIDVRNYPNFVIIQGIEEHWGISSQRNDLYFSWCVLKRIIRTTSSFLQTIKVLYNLQIWSGRATSMNLSGCHIKTYSSRTQFKNACSHHNVWPMSDSVCMYKHQTNRRKFCYGGIISWKPTTGFRWKPFAISLALYLFFEFRFWWRA